jgi:hypothetical protein
VDFFGGMIGDMVTAEYTQGSFHVELANGHHDRSCTTIFAFPCYEMLPSNPFLNLNIKAVKLKLNIIIQKWITSHIPKGFTSKEIVQSTTIFDMILSSKKHPNEHNIRKPNKRNEQHTNSQRGGHVLQNLLNKARRM